MKMLIGAAVASLLGGCAMPTDDLLNNRYMERRQETVPVGVAGDWTGTMGPYLVTVRLAADGTGLMCSSYNTNNTVINLKYAAGVLYFQDGTRMEIAKVGETLAGKTPYFGSATTKLYPDMGLSQAAPYCKKAM